ncbi:MAG: hypothetical protein IH934_04640 [Nanoarchaeota archaeon]|nr:hypothetical protein [Nanoarchaeota archaeon]
MKINHFNIRRRGIRQSIPIIANNRGLASMKLKMLIRGRNMFMIPDFTMLPNSLSKSRRIFKGR